MIAAYILITWGPAASPETLAGLRAVDGVKTVHGLIGPTDAIAYVEVADQEALFATIMGMRAVEGIGFTDTRLAWSNF